MSSWTPEPWRVGADGTRITDSVEWALIADCDRARTGREPQENEANTARIVAAVNACAGLNPSAYQECVDALREVLRLTMPAECGGSAPRALEKVQRALAHAEQRPS